MGVSPVLKKYAMPLGIWLLFAAIAVGLWLGLKNIFYLFNFLYIGTGLAAGLALFAQGKKWARNAVQWVVGLYLLVFLGARLEQFPCGAADDRLGFPGL